MRTIRNMKPFRERIFEEVSKAANEVKLAWVPLPMRKLSDFGR